MQLSVPERAVADADSFPLEPSAVARWLDGLWPLAVERDARELYRGLKHSNRLHNDPERRRAVLGCFVPVLRALHEQLLALLRAQPLPLAREFSRGAELLSSLLREEAVAFQILLADSAAPDPDDARRAMQALARQGEISAYAYRALDETLLGNAHRLYALAEERGLLDGTEPGTSSLADHYRYLLLLALADTRQLRARQLPLALEFLQGTADAISLEPLRAAAAPAIGAEGGGERLGARVGVDLARGTRPEPLAALLVENASSLRVFDLAPLLERIDRQIERTRVVPSAPGIDRLERQTLGRLHSALARTRARRGARIIADTGCTAMFGHREIAARLLFDPARAARGADEDEGDAAGWSVRNRSVQGLCLVRADCRPGSVQVGELVALGEGEARRRGARDATRLGIVRWAHAGRGNAIALGVEYFARGVVPAAVTRGEGESVAEHGLLVTCRVRQRTVQTILLPPHLYEAGERLVARQGTHVRRLHLRACLQSNGLFSHFSLG